jgi:rfaE bifunctional protein kinase chain/domain
MTRERFHAVTERYALLQVAVLGDFCLDRYLEIDPARHEISLETRLEVHNVVNVRAQPGGAGTILNNLVALGTGTLWPVGFCGDDGEGYELSAALSRPPAVRLEHFLRTDLRRTFTYCKPLVLTPDQPPRELNRLDSKNWSPTPAEVEDALIAAVRDLAAEVNALVLLDQVDQANTGVVTQRVLAAVGDLGRERPELLILADSRRGLAGFPPIGFKMNAAELSLLTGMPLAADLDRIQNTAAELAAQNRRPVFVTLAERGIVGALADGTVGHVPALPLRGPIDIVGAGDAVTANLACALAAGATLHESLEVAMAAASIVIHQLGTTGTASVVQIQELLASLA